MNERFEKWLNDQTPGSYLDSAPAVITIGGTEFNWIDGYKTITANGRTEYHTVYQASEIINGEYPCADIVVTETARGKCKRYVFNRHPLVGCGIK